MGRRGPKAKPTAVKKFEGNPGKRKLNRSEPQPTPAPPGSFAPPDWLIGLVALARWRDLAPKLAKNHLLTELDFDMLGILCQSWQEVQDCRKTLGEEGDYITTDKGFVVQHPAVGRMTKALERIRKLNAEFGMSPSARSGLKLPGNEKPAGKLGKYTGHG